MTVFYYTLLAYIIFAYLHYSSHSYTTDGVH